MIHIPGARHKAADAVSRYPTDPTNPDLRILPDDVAATNDSVIPLHPSGRSSLAGIRCNEPSQTSCSFPIDDQLTSSVSSALNTMAITWDRVKLATTSDQEILLQLVSTIESCFPEQRHALPPTFQEYHQFHEHLYTVDGVILYKNRIVIPPSLRQQILTVLHSAHQGGISMTARAETTVFWPGITPAITALRTNCNHCNRMTPSQPNAPPFPFVPPAYPFQCVCADFFHHKGVNYLIVDRYSNRPIIEWAQEGSNSLIDCLLRTFVTFGIPDECVTDGGPEFTAATTHQFLKEWEVHHRLSSVANDSSLNNTSPHGSLNTETLQRAILQYCNTPDPNTKLSPAQCVFGRPIKDFMPILERHPRCQRRSTEEQAHEGS